MVTQQRRRDVGWLERNITRAYPFDNSSNRISDDGLLRLPDNLLSSIYIHVTPRSGLDRTGFYLRRVTLSSDLLFLQISYTERNREEQSVVAEGELTRQTAYHQFFELPTTDDWAGNRIYGLIGRWPDLTTSAVGSYQFNPAATRLASDCIRITTPRVSSLRVRSGAQVSPKFSGTVRLQSSPSIRFQSSEPETGVRSVRVDAVPPQQASGQSGTALQQINNVGPAPDGNFNLVGLKCTEVNNGGGFIDLRNTCGDPCCGCDEIHGLVDELKDGLQTSNDLERRLQKVNDNIKSLKPTRRTQTTDQPV